jgi:hypothetical protein
MNLPKFACLREQKQLNLERHLIVLAVLTGVSITKGL